MLWDEQWAGGSISTKMSGLWQIRGEIWLDVWGIRVIIVQNMLLNQNPTLCEEFGDVFLLPVNIGKVKVARTLLIWPLLGNYHHCEKSIRTTYADFFYIMCDKHGSIIGGIRIFEMFV